MGAVLPDELARLWSQEQITTDMAIGQITQNLVRLQSAIDSQRQMLQTALEVQRQMLVALQGNLEKITKDQTMSRISRR
ncbi:MAG: hypothetical protein WCK70_06625 [Chloroflexales bacterium]